MGSRTSGPTSFAVLIKGLGTKTNDFGTWTVQPYLPDRSLGLSVLQSPLLGFSTWRATYTCSCVRNTVEICIKFKQSFPDTCSAINGLHIIEFAQGAARYFSAVDLVNALLFLGVANDISYANVIDSDLACNARYDATQYKPGLCLPKRG